MHICFITFTLCKTHKRRFLVGQNRTKQDKTCKFSWQSTGSQLCFRFFFFTLCISVVPVCFITYATNLCLYVCSLLSSVALLPVCLFVFLNPNMTYEVDWMLKANHFSETFLIKHCPNQNTVVADTTPPAKHHQRCVFWASFNMGLENISHHIHTFQLVCLPVFFK